MHRELLWGMSMVGSSVWGDLTQPTYERLGALRALVSTPSPRFGICYTKGSNPVKLEVILHLQVSFYVWTVIVEKPLISNLWWSHFIVTQRRTEMDIIRRSRCPIICYSFALFLGTVELICSFHFSSLFKNFIASHFLWHVLLAPEGHETGLLINFYPIPKYISPITSIFTCHRPQMRQTQVLMSLRNSAAVVRTVVDAVDQYYWLLKRQRFVCDGVSLCFINYSSGLW